MTTVPLLAREALLAEDRPAYDRVAESRGGTMPVIFQALAHAPGGMEPVATLGGYLRFRSPLDPLLREAVILAVVREVDCTLEWKQHLQIARGLGMGEEVVAALEGGTLAGRPGLLGAACGVALQVVRRERLRDAPATAELRAHLGDRGIVEVALLATYYMMLDRLIHSLETDAG